jgi:hypothetical protein
MTLSRYPVLTRVLLSGGPLLLASSGGTAELPRIGRLVPAAGGAGASLPYVELQAENAATNGTVIGPSFIYNQLACEASGRRAVTLAGQGRFVEFTLPSAANSIVVRYSIPDAPGGSVYTASLSLYINGVKQPSLTLTNAYSWYYGSYPFTNAPGSNPHHFYDEVHRLLPAMAAGARVRLQVDAGDTASSYTIDLADFEQVAPPLAQPANSVSVTSFGADPTGNNDSTSAFHSAVANAAGRTVFIPAGTFRVNGHVSVNNVRIQGAGMWHSIVTGQGVGFFGHFPPTPSTNVHLSHFQIRGNVQERNDGDPVNGIGGALQDSTVSDIWIEHTKVGAWVTGPFRNLTFSRMRIRNQTADGINFQNGVTGSTVTQSHFRNLGDDALAMWSEHNADANNSFTFNTVELPILANGIAIYGGRDITVSDNRVVDSGLSQGGGIHVGNRFAAVPVAGVIQIRRNTIVRAGDLDPNWRFGVGALWFDARDQAMTGQIVVDDLLIQQSPYEAIQFISGSNITNVSISNVTITGTGTFVLQLQVGGSATFTNVVATGVNGPAGIYNCGVGFTVIDGGGNSGWQTTFCGPWPDPVFPPPVGVSASPTALAFGAQTTGTTSAAQSVLVTNSASTAAAITAISVTGDFMQASNCGTSLGAGASCTVSVAFRPTATGARTGTLTIASNAGTSTVSLSGTGTAPGPALSATPSSLSFATTVVGTTSAAQPVTVRNTGTAAASITSIAASGDFAQANDCGASLGVGASCIVSVTFRPTAAGSRTGALTITSNAVNSPASVALAGTAVSTTTNVALGRPATASSSVNGAQTPNLAVDGNPSSYWESANHAFPQWLQVDLGSALSIGRVVVKLPPATAWATRVQTLSVLGSTDGTAFTTLVPAAGYTFDPAAGNAVTITFPATSQRHLRLNFTANTGWPAGQASELEVYPAGSVTPAALTATPSSLTFAGRTVGSTSPAQAVTLRNPGTASATLGAISTSGDFAQTHNCGGSLAAGASCTINVTFRPTAAGARTGVLSVPSSAPGSPTTVTLSGTGVSAATNLALGKTMSASSSVNGSFTPNLANDDNPSSYWESANHAFPQWLQVDLGAPTAVGRIVIRLPPSTTWGARTQTLSVTGSDNGSTYTTIVASAAYRFDPATGNLVTITFPATSRRFLRLDFTANTGWPAGQASELQVFAP